MGTELTNMKQKILMIEPPKDYWFLMGEYLPPPTALLALAAYIKRELPKIDVEVLDCQAEQKNWNDIEKYISSSAPTIVATSGYSCNAYVCARTAEIAKKINSEITTIVGGQHFTFTAEQSLMDFPEIDFIVRGEGEVTTVKLLEALQTGKGFARIKGISYTHETDIIHNPDRDLIENLDTLPYPAYELVGKNLNKYHFTMMAGKNKRYLILEGSRGCRHKCTFCAQWKHWSSRWRTKSAERIADEMEHLHNNYGGEFLWLTDDNFDYRTRGQKLYNELRSRKFFKNISWFFQARTDDIASNPNLVKKLGDVGNSWILVGVENDSPKNLKYFRKNIKVSDAGKAMKILRANNIFAQAMMIIGSRSDTSTDIERLRKFSLEIEPDLALYTVLTPYPGTDIYEEAMENNWIEDTNYAHYDMVHAIMPTETLTRQEVQEELYQCYRYFYGSIPRNIAGLFSKNEIKKRCYRHMAGKSVLRKLRSLI
jgi:anaerobic magnesium-protoporphyrin IX monomethyl ester cyclase